MIRYRHADLHTDEGLVEDSSTNIMHLGSTPLRRRRPRQVRRASLSHSEAANDFFKAQPSLRNARLMALTDTFTPRSQFRNGAQG